MTTHDAWRLAEAERARQRALETFGVVSRRTRFGRTDHRAFERALEALLAAEHAVLDARSRWLHRLPSPAATGTAGSAQRAPEGPVPAQSEAVDAANAANAADADDAVDASMARLRFVRWLVQTGRLSDW